jgi:fatty acid desaturase
LTARLKWWQAILIGPVFIYRLHLNAWRLASVSKRRWIGAEIITIIGIIVLAIFARNMHALQWHVGAMLMGECLTGFFAVWTVHHGCEMHVTHSRTQRGRWVNWFCYSMFYHAEHHVFPQVPTCHLRVLAARFDHAAFKFADKQVIELSAIQLPSQSPQTNADGIG